jgi:hypothetical protein
VIGADVRGPTHFYVWYTVRGDLQAAVAAIGALLEAVAAQTGVSGRLLARRDDPSTWMEIYENVEEPQAFERALDEQAARHGATSVAEGGRRHTERFAALADALA